MTNQELRELRERMTYYSVAGQPLPEEDVESVKTAITAYLNLRPTHVTQAEAKRVVQASS